MTLSLYRPISTLCTLAACAAFLLTSGCQSTGPEPMFMDFEPDPAAAPLIGEPSLDAEPAQERPATGLTDIFRVGDVVTVSVTGVRSESIPEHHERIKDDGTINLYLVGSVQAAGRSPGDVQRDLQQRYEVYFKNPVVTIQSMQRFYYVGGEVKQPGAKVYLGETTVTKAIQAAGDFTDFGKKTNVRVIRADGTLLKVNVNKAIDDPSLDPPIYPGDKIHVPRRILW